MKRASVHEYAKHWRDSELGNLELLRARYVTFAFTPHFHETFAIGMVEEGAHAFVYRRKQHMFIPTGCVAVVNPGEIHTSQAADDEGVIYRMLYPDPALLQRIACEVVGRGRDLPCFKTPVIHDVFLARLIQYMHSILEEPRSTLLERESWLTWGMTQLIARHADDRPTVQKVPGAPMCVNRIRAYLHQMYADDVSLAQLAKLVNLSPFHLLRVFRDAVGVPPHTYQILVRVNRVQKLLRAGGSIADVAMQTGFFDQSHLTRHFKRVVGTTPGQFCRSSNSVQDILC